MRNRSWDGTLGDIRCFGIARKEFKGKPEEYIEFRLWLMPCGLNEENKKYEQKKKRFSHR